MQVVDKHSHGCETRTRVVVIGDRMTVYSIANMYQEHLERNFWSSLQGTNTNCGGFVELHPWRELSARPEAARISQR